MTAFAENALGFFIQLFPCALMIFLPFPQETYRIQRRQVFIWVTVISVILALLFSAVLCFDRYPGHIIISNAFMVVSILLILAVCTWLVRESLMKKILVFIIVLFYAVTVFVMVNLIHTLWYPNTADTAVYTGGFLLLYAVVTAFLLPLMLAAVIRPLEKYIQMIEPREMRQEFFITGFTTLVYFVMAVYSDTVLGKEKGSRYFLLPLLFLTLNQVVIYWLLFQESVRRKRDSERQRAMEIQRLQYEKIVGDMENTRQMRHDLRHHYNFLNDMLDRGQLDEMKAYLSNVIDTTVRRDNETYCMNMTVNGLLQYYAGIARDAGIRCEVHARCGELAIEPVDLTVLFGNAMENALNACRKYPENPWISIQVGTVQGSLAVEISNSCNGVSLNRHVQTEDGFLPAEAFQMDQTSRRYGLRSIAQTAQKYGGSARFRFNAEKEMFTAQIRLNMYTDL